MARLGREYGPTESVVTYLVKEEHNDMRLDLFLMSHLTSLSREFIKSKISKNEIRIERLQGLHKPSTRVKHRDIVKMTTYKSSHEDEYWNGEKIELNFNPEIIFESDKHIAISKPAFMSTHPTGKHLFNCATVVLQDKSPSPICSIHRLDRETSGLLILGKNPPAAGELTNEFENKRVQKAYFLIGVKNSKEEIKFPLTALERLGKHDNPSGRLVTFAYEQNSSDGKLAQTDFIELYQDETYIIALAFPKTGRQHQIRVHAAHHGFPLLGDKIYNGDSEIFGRFKDFIATKEDYDKMQICRHALHSIALQFKKIKHVPLLVSMVPKDLEQWIEKNLDINIANLNNSIKSLISSNFSQPD